MNADTFKIRVVSLSCCQAEVTLLFSSVCSTYMRFPSHCQLQQKQKHYVHVHWFITTSVLAFFPCSSVRNHFLATSTLYM